MIQFDQSHRIGLTLLLAVLSNMSPGQTAKTADPIPGIEVFVSTPQYYVDNYQPLKKNMLNFGIGAALSFELTKGYLTAGVTYFSRNYFSFYDVIIDTVEVNVRQISKFKTLFLPVSYHYPIVNGNIRITGNIGGALSWITDVTLEQIIGTKSIVYKPQEFDYRTGKWLLFGVSLINGRENKVIRLKGELGALVRLRTDYNDVPSKMSTKYSRPGELKPLLTYAQIGVEISFASKKQ